MVRWINQFKISLKLTRMPHYDMRSFLTTVAISRDSVYYRCDGAERKGRKWTEQPPAA